MTVDFNERRYTYMAFENNALSSFKSFRSFKKMWEFAENPEHNGIYYIQSPVTTDKYTREQIREKRSK